MSATVEATERRGPPPWTPANRCLRVSLPPSMETLSQVALFLPRVAFLGPGEPRCSPGASRECSPCASRCAGTGAGPSLSVCSGHSPGVGDWTWGERAEFKPQPPRLLRCVRGACSPPVQRNWAPLPCRMSPEPTVTVRPSLSRDGRGPRAACGCACAQLPTCGLSATCLEQRLGTCAEKEAETVLGH